MRQRHARPVLMLLMLAGGFAAAPSEAQTPVPLRLLSAGMSEGRGYHTATRLGDGRVLIAGGPASSAVVELFDPVSETFTRGPGMSSRRYLHTATRLPGGDVLIAGGSANPGILSTAEIYRAATGTLEPIGSLPGPRAGHTATLLHDGTVLIAGGTDNAGPLASAVVFDPATETFSATGPMQNRRLGHQATLLPDGRVLITGGADASAAPLDELYDPITATFATLPNAVRTTRLFSHTATIASGRVVLFGGVTVRGGDTPLDSGEVFSLSEETYQPSSALTLPRAEHTATALADGSILFVGGNHTSQLRGMIEQYTVSGGSATVRIAGFLVRPRRAHTATLLDDGRVLILGGVEAGASAFSNTAEIYPGPDPTTALQAQVAALTSQVLALQDEVAGFAAERAGLLAEIARLQEENADLRQQLAGGAAPTGTGGMTGWGTVVAGTSRHVFELQVQKATDGNLKLALAFKVCEQGPGQADDDLQCLSRRHRLSVAYFTAVQFSDDPGFASSGDSSTGGVDTLVLNGVGAWDGVEGYRFTVTATDRGDEPGPNTDTFEIVVTAPDGSIVTSVVGTLAAGNLEAM